MTHRMGSCIALLLLVPAPAVAQDQVPSPPKQEIVTIRSAGGTLDLKGVASADAFEFTQQCEARQGYSAATSSLTLPLVIEGAPNASLAQATKLLRDAVARGLLVAVESATEPPGRPPLVTFTWGGLQVFEGVIESLNVKYTMFLPDGTPTRATVTLRMKEAGALLNKKENQEGDQPGKKQPDCSPQKH